MDRTEVFAKTFEALDKLLAPSPESVAEQQRIAAVLAAQKADEAEFRRYAAQRDMGLEHDKIIRFYKSRDAQHFQAWYRDERLEDNVTCWPDNPNAERCRVRDEVGMGSEFDGEPR